MADDGYYSINDYPGDGVQTTFEISFAGGYISRDHVSARIIYADNTWLDVVPTWTGDNTVLVTPAPPSGTTMRFYRVTPIEKPLVDYTNGALLNEASLDTQAKQAIFAAAESRDAFGTVPGNDTLRDAIATLAFARSRANHTGTQAISTITGLTAQLFAATSFTPPGPQSIVRIITSKLGDMGTSIKDKGALGTGSSATADRLGMLKAMQDTQASGKYIPGIDGSYWAHPQDTIYLPPGVYDASDIEFLGNSQPFPSVQIVGSPGETVIRAKDGEYAIRINQRVNRVYVKGITFVGGKGAFQSTYTGVNVNGNIVFEDCIFDNYTECAIGNNAVDAPYLEVNRCIFMAKTGSTAFGIAWGGYADGCVVMNSKFLRNYCHIKWGPYQSGSIHFLNVDMLRWDSTTPFAACFWFVPNDTDPNGVNSGNGTTLHGIKFGNENMQGNDVRVLVAKEAAGTNRQTRLPDFNWYAGGAYLSGMTIENCRVAGNSSTAAPLIRSYVGQVRNLTYRNNRHDGGSHTVLVEFMGTRANDYANMNWNVDLRSCDGYPEGLPFSNGVTNGTNLIGVQDDPDGLYGNQELASLPGAGGDDASFMPFVSADRSVQFTNFAPNGTYGGASAVATNDASGKSRAVEVSVTGVGQGLYFPLGSTVSENRQVRASLTIARAATPAQSLFAVRVFLENQATGQIKAVYRRLVLTAGYNKVRLRFQLPTSPNKDAWQLKVESADYASGANKFRVAAVYCYQGRDYANDAGLNTLADGKWDGGHIVMKNTHIWEEAGKLYVKTTGAPTSGTDGTIVGTQVA